MRVNGVSEVAVIYTALPVLPLDLVNCRVLTFGAGLGDDLILSGRRNKIP